MGRSSAALLAHGADGAAASGGLPPYDLAAALTEWRLDPWPLLGLALAAAGYLWGLHRLALRGRRWSRRRTASFATGLAALLVATQSSLGAYDETLFSVHVAQHMVLSMVGPFFLALGAPVTLLLQASDRRVQVSILGVLHSRPAALLTHPLTVVALFGLTLYGLYFTPLYELSLRNGLVHELVHVHFTLAGSLFFWVVVGLDPVGRRVPFGARLGLVLATVPLHAFLGIALMAGNQPVADGWYEQVRTWGPSPLVDQRTGGAVMWGVGELLSLAAGAVVLRQWMASEDRATDRAERAERRSEAVTG